MLETVKLAKNAAPASRKINGKNLTQDVQLTAADVNAATQEMLRVEIPVGVPLPWPTESAPTGWFICNGEPFDKKKHPLLSLAYPSGKLPDLRGEFIRGWDAGRKVNPGRKLLSPEGDAFLDHDHAIITRGPGEGNFVSPLNDHGTTSDGDNYLIGVGIYRTYKASKLGDYRTASETRPRNVAFNYIVRAA